MGLPEFRSDFTFNQDAFSGLHAEMMPALFGTRYTMPPPFKDMPEELAKYDDAAQLAKAVKPTPGMRWFVVLNGSFIFGDFIEALLVENGLHAKEVIISTLSLSENNVDSLAGLMQDGYIDYLDLITSAYQHSHELHNLVPYLLEKLDVDNRFQYAAAGTHCKICLIETHCGLKLTLHGSANLRSSGNIEQVMIEEGAALYDFNLHYHRAIVDRYKVINHHKPLHKTTPLRHSSLWQTVQPGAAAGAGQAAALPPQQPNEPTAGEAA